MTGLENSVHEREPHSPMASMSVPRATCHLCVGPGGPGSPWATPNVVSPSLRYSVEGFLDKNKDTLFQDFKRLFYNRLGTQGT